jgi:hypothetical protein
MADKIIGLVVAMACAGLGVAASQLQPVPLWIPITLSVLGVLGSSVKVGLFNSPGGGDHE